MSGSYHAPFKQSRPFRMPQTPFNPATGTYLPLGPGPGGDWWKIIAHWKSDEPGSHYRLRRQQWSTSASNFVDAPGRTAKGYEINKYANIPTGEIAVDAMPKFYAVEQRTFESGKKIVLFDWMAIQPEFWAIITDSTVDGTTNRWDYDWHEAIYASKGGWAELENGRSSTSGHLTSIHNTIESINTGSAHPHHVEGNGVTVDDLETADALYYIKPCTTHNIVRVSLTPLISSVTGIGNGQFYPMISYENGVSGACR